MDDVSAQTTVRDSFTEELIELTKLRAFHRMIFYNRHLKLNEAYARGEYKILLYFHAFYSLVSEEVFRSPLVIGLYIHRVLLEDGMTLHCHIREAREIYGVADVMSRELLPTEEKALAYDDPLVLSGGV